MTRPARRGIGALEREAEGVGVPQRSRSFAGSRMFRIFPMSTLLSLQYAALVILPMVRGNRVNLTVLSIIALGLLACSAVELGLVIARPSFARSSVDNPLLSFATCVVISVIGLAAIALTSLGSMSYATQVGLSSSSSVDALFTPLAPLALMGPSMMMHQARSGAFTRNRTMFFVASVIVVRLMLAVVAGITAPAMAFALAMSATALLLGTIRARTFAIGLMLGVLLWPLVHSLRNEVRVRMGEDRNLISLTQADSSQRLELDRLMIRVESVDLETLSVNTPDLFQIARYGLVPRILDRSRPPLWTSREVSSALGGSYTNSDTLTLFGNIYAIWGLVAVVAYCMVVAVLGMFASRSSGCLSAVMFALLVNYLVWIESTVPDNVVALLQSTVTVMIVWLAIRIFGSRGKRVHARFEHQVARSRIAN